MRHVQRLLSAGTLLCLLLLQPLSVHAQAASQQNSSPSSQTAPAEPQQASPGPNDNATYKNRQGQTVQRPQSSASAPKGATAQCRDGSYSFSQGHRGACSHHGGVAKWL